MTTGSHPFARAAAAASLLLASGPLSAQDEPVRYARVAVDDAVIRNVADDHGIEVHRPQEGTLLSVWKEVAGWLEVEVPEGYVAWVHGRYLDPVDPKGELPAIHEVTRNAINIRPRPKSDVTSFPLPQRLHAGDRVLVLELAEPGVPPEENWARIVTPPGVRAWIRGDRTEPLADGEAGEALWRDALAARAEEPRGVLARSEPDEAEANTAGTARDEAARAELASVRARIDAAGEGATVEDLQSVRRELEALAARAAGGPVAISVQTELDRVAALAELARVRAELEEERRRREEELWDRRTEVREASRRKDPLGGVFQGRGVLVRTYPAGDVPRYHLRFGGELTAEVLCTSGRYDLELFTGREVGVFGDPLVVSETDGDGAVPVLDARRIEVLRP